MAGDLKVFGGINCGNFTEDICRGLGQDPGAVICGQHSDGERKVTFEENIRDADVFLVQQTGPPAENMLNLFLMIDAAKRASAKRVTAVVHYYGYGRGDRKEEGRVPIAAKLFADLIVAAGVNRVLTMDLHAGQIQGFFPNTVPVDHLFARPIFIEHLRKIFREDYLSLLTFFAPDSGSVKLNRAYAGRMGGYPLAIVDKRRSKPNESEVLHILGEVSDRNLLEVDEMVDTAGTLVNAAEVAKKKGALEIRAVATHPVLSGPAIGKIQNSPISKLYVADTIPTPPEKRIGKIEVVSMAPIFAEAIKRIHCGESVSCLFD